MSKGRIVASKNGLMIASILIDETEKEWVVKYCDGKSKIRIRKEGINRRVFLNCEEAMEWIES